MGLKIAFIGARGIPHTYASAEELVYQVGSRLIDRGHTFIVYCHKNLFPKNSLAVYEGFQRIFIPAINHKYFGQGVHALLSSIDVCFRDVDIIHVQCLNNVFQAIIPWVWGKSVMVNVDGQAWMDPKWIKWQRELFFGLARRVAVKISLTFVTDAQGMREIYLNDFKRDSAVIEYGADLEISSNAELLDLYGLEPQKYYFVAARISQGNKTDVIIDAFNKVNSERILVIAGGHSYGSNWSKELAKRVGERVRFLGHISDRAHIKELYCNAFAYLHGASLGGVNSALLRPLGCGCCVLAFDTPFNREVIEMKDGNLAGFLWRNADELSNKIELIENDFATLETMRRRGATRIREAFTWDRIANQYEVLYKGIAEGLSSEIIRKQVAAV